MGRTSQNCQRLAQLVPAVVHLETAAGQHLLEALTLLTGGYEPVAIANEEQDSLLHLTIPATTTSKVQLLYRLPSACNLVTHDCISSMRGGCQSRTCSRRICSLLPGVSTSMRASAAAGCL